MTFRLLLMMVYRSSALRGLAKRREGRHGFCSRFINGEEDRNSRTIFGGVQPIVFTPRI